MKHKKAKNVKNEKIKKSLFFQYIIIIGNDKISMNSIFIQKIQ